MKRKLVLAVVAAVLVIAIAVPTAFAAVSDTQKQSIIDNINKMFALQKQMVQTYVDSGLVTQEQADFMLKNMETRTNYQIDAVNSGTFAPGAGRRGGIGGGCGMGGGFGGGFGGFRTGAAAQI